MEKDGVARPFSFPAKLPRFDRKSLILQRNFGILRITSKIVCIFCEMFAKTGKLLAKFFDFLCKTDIMLVEFSKSFVKRKNLTNFVTGCKNRSHDFANILQNRGGICKYAGNKREGSAC